MNGKLKEIRDAIASYYGAPVRFCMDFPGCKPTLAVYKRNGRGEWRWCGSVDEHVRQCHLGLSIRDDVETLEYHRPPTAGEINFGEGGTHYCAFGLDECCYEGTRIPKRWFVDSRSGLRYYR